MKATITALGLGLLAGATAVALPIPQASAETYMIQQADPQDTAPVRERNGVLELKPSDEQFTNEMANFVFDPVNKDTGIVVMMSTGQLDGAAGPNAGAQIQVGRMQGACMPVKLVQDEASDAGVAIQPVVSQFKYITQRQAEDYRAFNIPEVVALGNNMFAVTANWDRNNNTNTDRYLQVVNQNCELQQLTGGGPGTQIRENNTSIRIMAKNNDNCAGGQSGKRGDQWTDANGVVHLVTSALCNGNGADDGWYNHVSVACNGGTCDVRKIDDTSYITREERSRGKCEAMDTTGDGNADMSFCCGTEGNNQPQREGVWCAGIDNATGDLLYRERVAYRGETLEGLRTYAMRIKMMAEKDVTGADTGNVMLQYQMHRGNNNTDKKGGYDDKILLATAKPNRQGVNVTEMQDLTNMVITNRTEFTHSTMFQTFTGSAAAPQTTYAFLTGNHNANQISAKALNLTMQAGKAFDDGVTTMGAPYDHQKYSKYLGNNPNNQGRNYNQCNVVPNPFADLPGKASGIPVLNLCAMNGKMSSVEPQIKPDLLMEVWTSLQAAATPVPAPAPGAELPDVSTPEGGSTTSNELPGQTVGGCSVSNGSMGGSAMFLLFGLALALRRRRS